MIQARALHSLTALPGGAVLAFGGSPGAGVVTPVSSYELYLP